MEGLLNSVLGQVECGANLERCLDPLLDVGWNGEVEKE